MEPFAGPRRADHDCGVLDAGPHVRALAAPHPVTDIGGCRLRQRRTQERCGGGQPAGPGVLEDVFPVGQPGETMVGLGLGLPAGGEKDPPADPDHHQGGRRVDSGDGPVHGHRADGDTPRFGRVASMSERGQAGQLAVGWKMVTR